MARKEQSIQYELCQNVLPQIKNDHTRKMYKNSIKESAGYCKTEGIRKPSELYKVKRKMIQKYEKELEKQGYSASTIHSKLAGVCKALTVKMDSIEKPQRKAAIITKGREEKTRAAEQLENKRYERSVELEQGLGIRRSELKALKQGCLKRDESGQLCIEVLSGKGGERQLQRILPEHIDTVKRIVAEPKGKGGRILDDKEIGSHINYHEIRREVARKSYDYYRDRTQNDPDYTRGLKVELVKRYMEMHPKKPTREQAIKWVKDMIGLSEGQYILRGGNKQKAIESGKPVVYDRLSLLAVSVFHLSHWRLDVTVNNYML